MEIEKDKILTINEILEIYPGRFSRTTLWRLKKRGELKPCGKKGNKDLLWRQSAIDKYLTRFDDVSLAA